MLTQKKAQKIRIAVSKIMSGDFPRIVGQKDMLVECWNRSRHLTIVAFVNGEKAQVINDLVDQTELIEKLAFNDKLKIKFEKAGMDHKANLREFIQIKNNLIRKKVA